MPRNKVFKIEFKRKREGKTDYKKRLKYIKSEKIRIVIRPLSNTLIIQGIEFNQDGDKVLTTIQSKDLKKLGWSYGVGNTPSAYLTGLLFGVKNKSKIKEGIIDLGIRSITKGDRMSAAIKGIIDSGIKVPHSDSIFPDKNRIDGTIIVEYAKHLSSNQEKYKKQFSKYLKNNSKPEDMPKKFEEIKQKILKNE